MKKISPFLGVVVLAFPIGLQQAKADLSIQEHLRRFRENPKEYMKDPQYVKKLIREYDVIARDEESQEPTEYRLRSEREASEGEIIIPFSEESVRSREYVIEKNRAQDLSGVSTRKGRAGYLRNDDPQALVGSLRVKTLEQMESAGLKSMQLSHSPWSGDYWAIYAGGVAKRYADEGFPHSRDWQSNATYVQSSEPSDTDLLSPAEKYDLLVGDPDKSLTQFALAEGKRFYDANDGVVEHWMGICHGWAPASYREQRPHHSTWVKGWSADRMSGPLIKFYPSDIKALASLLWAKAQPKSRFIGSRCEKKNPATDENGRVIDQECFDTNPGTWHLVVVNQIGVKKKSFILDATYDYEVWNQPIFSYEYRYFNPQTGLEVDTLDEAKVALSDFSEDKFKRYRDRRTKSVVGVAMKLTYIAETRASSSEQDSSSFDRRVVVNYLYDLELDESGTIIGGEWYHQLHPDFLWAPAEEEEIRSIGDIELDSRGSHENWLFRGYLGIFNDWHEAAMRSSKRGQPLARIIRELISKSRKLIDNEVFR